MSTEIELERTFLARELPAGLDRARSLVIRDIYIPETADHAVLRLRQKGEKYEITKKEPVVGDDSSQQYEHTIPLTQVEFEALATASRKDFVKRRYFMQIAGRDAEVDVYGEKLTGLVVIDFEFASIADKDSFETPTECLADVTQDVVIAGGFLAGKSYRDIAVSLATYGYKPIQGGF